MKNLLLLVLFIFLDFINAESQVPDWLWARSSSCGSPAAAAQENDVAGDNFGNVYVTGFFRDTSLSFGSVTLNNFTVSDASVFVAKYDSSGNALWAKNASGTANGFPTAIATDASGSVYLTGYFNNGYIVFGNDTLLLAVTGGHNFFLVKYDSSGNFSWAERGGGQDVYANSYGVTTDTLANVYITGVFQSSNISFGSCILTKSGSASMFIVKYDSSGNCVWAKNPYDTYIDEGNSVSSDSPGNTYVTGNFRSSTIIFGTDTLYNSLQNANDMFLARYDFSGNVLWAKSAGGTGNDYGESVTTNSLGNAYVTGRFNSPSVIFGSDTLYYNGINDNTYLAKYDSLGNVLWARSFEGGNPFKIVSDSLDNTYMNGFMFNPIVFDTLTLQMPGFYDPMFIVKYNLSGHALWAKGLASGANGTRGITFGTNKSLYIGGSFTNNLLIVGTDSLIATCTEDVFIAKLGYTSTVGIHQSMMNEDFSLFPNPFSNKLTITTNNNDLSEILLYDIASRKLLQQKFTNTITLNTAQLAKGMYLYEVITVPNSSGNKNGLVKKGKVVKE